MRTLWEWIRGRPAQPDADATQALADATQSKAEAEARGAQADLAAAELRTHLRANHFDQLLANAVRPR